MKHRIKFACGCKETKFFWCLNEIHDFVEFIQSTLPEAGVGLFAKKDIPNNTALSWYKGHLIPADSKSFKPSYCWNFISDLTNERNLSLSILSTTVCLTAIADAARLSLLKIAISPKKSPDDKIQIGSSLPHLSTKIDISPFSMI